MWIAAVAYGEGNYELRKFDHPETMDICIIRNFDHKADSIIHHIAVH